jgi:Holliday junction resolvase RusA-like endonuclease
VRAIPDRRPRYSLWMKERPLSSRSRNFKGYADRIRAEARKQVQGPPLSSTRIDIEIIFATRGTGDVDNVAKRILDAMEGVVYNKDEQVRSVKIVGLRLDRSFYARGFNAVFQRLLYGGEFLVNVYEGGEVDVYIVDSTIPEGEKSGVVMLSKESSLGGIFGRAAAGPGGPTIEIERIELPEEPAK